MLDNLEIDLVHMVFSLFQRHTHAWVNQIRHCHPLGKSMEEIQVIAEVLQSVERFNP